MGRKKTNTFAYKKKLSVVRKILKMIDELENPYPLDIFPKLELDDMKCVDFLLDNSNFNISMDRLSAELMRRARENLKEELKQKLKEMK